MLVDPVRPPRKPAPGRRDGHPPQKPREPISGDSRTVPRPRRHRDCRRQRRRCLTALPRAQRLSHNPPEGGLAEAPEGRDNIQAAARWLPTSDSNVPRTGRCRRPPGTPPRRPPKRPSSARSLRRRATRRDATPAAEEGRDAGKDLLRRLPRRRCTPPSDSRVVGGIHFMETQAGARGGVGRERGSSGILDSLASLPRKREGGREGGTGKVKPGKCCCKTGKVKPGKCCCKNKAGLWKADPDTQAQEQERKRRHSGPQQEKT